MTAPLALLVCDVDGTLVDSRKQLSPATIAAVRKLEEAGLPFTLISARPPSGMFRLAGTLDIAQPMAAFNGGTLFRPDGTILARHLVDEEVVRGIFALADGSGATPWLFADGKWYVRDSGNPHVAHERIASDSEPVVRADFDGLLGRVDKLTWVSDDSSALAKLLADARGAFGTRATIAQSQTYYLDITHPRANKGDGLAALAQAIGVDPGAVAVIGDMPNDLPMFARAGLSIAMGQAPAGVRERAGFVTASNDDDGVAQAIAAIILPRLAKEGGQA